MPSSEIRKEAREALKGNWGKAICILLALIFFSFVLGLVEGFLANNKIMHFLIEISVLIISIPLSFGLLISFIKLKRRENVKAFGFLKDGFSNFGKSWGIAWHIFIRMLLPIICIVLIMVSFTLIISINTSSRLLNAASSAADTYKKALEQEQLSLYQSNSKLTSYSTYDSTYLTTPKTIEKQEKVNTNSSFVNSPLFSILFLVLYIAALIYTVSRALLYVLAYNICYDNPKLSSRECVLKSAALMKGHRGSFFLLQLYFMFLVICVYLVSIVISFLLSSSIIGALLSVLSMILIVLITMFYITPYMQVSVICFYERLANYKVTAIKIEE